MLDFSEFLEKVTYTKAKGTGEKEEILTTIVRREFTILNKFEHLNSLVLTIDLYGQPYNLIVYLRRIHDNGFPNNRRPEIKRIQVQPIKEEMYTDSAQCFLLSGVAYYAGTPLLVVWNPFSCRGFSTNRSLYVSVASLKSAYDDGFYFGADCSTNVYICKEGYFKKLLNKYIKDTKFEAIEW